MTSENILNFLCGWAIRAKTDKEPGRGCLCRCIKSRISLGCLLTAIDICLHEKDFSMVSGRD